MSTATVKLKHGALATVTPDFMITRGITETHSLTLLNADNTPLINASVVTWTFQIAQDFLSRTSILAESTSITFANNVLSGILLNAHTVELKAFMQGKAIAPLYGTLIGLNGSAEVVTAITFRIVCTNSVYEPDAEPTPAIISGYYTKAQIDAKFAAVGDAIPAATTVARGTIQLAAGDEVTAGTDTAKAVVPSTLKTELDKKENTANKATDFSTVNNVKFPTTQAVKEFVQLETLTELTGADVAVAPWTQSKWSASGTCSLTATGWAVSGHQVAYVLITLEAEATLSVSGATVADDDALSAAGTYACYLVNENGTVRFRVANFTEAA